MELEQVKNIIEAALLVSEEPLGQQQLLHLFEQEELAKTDISNALEALQTDYQGRGIELKKLASGYQLQSSAQMQPWLSRLWQQKPRPYSRAFLETLALIAYRQPITRGEIEDIRGVAVSSKIIQSLMEREWIRILGYRDAPGKPAMLGTTKTFLDYFGLSSLEELPSLAEIKDIETLEPELEFASENTTETEAKTDEHT
ncbi:SMC-Scp complex subunit ScpB [Marinicella sp. W31]|uniref:SMC-Scp complex subunit ScpB n=1 Tax=Marinicella sp. W31 TaxID=3023713 RepID=UPI003756F3EE